MFIGFRMCGKFEDRPKQMSTKVESFVQIFKVQSKRTSILFLIMIDITLILILFA